MCEEQLNLFHILLQEEIKKEALLIHQYFGEFNLKDWHSFQDKNDTAGNCIDWWRSRWYDCFRHNKKWTPEIEKKEKYFDKVWEKFQDIIQRNRFVKRMGD